MFSSEMSKYHFIFLTSPIKETNKAKCYYLLSVVMNMGGFYTILHTFLYTFLKKYK